MAKETHVTFVDDATTANLVLVENVREATRNALGAAMGHAINAMSVKLEDSHTPTGERRAAGKPPVYDIGPRIAAWNMGRGPGRIESGALQDSLAWDVSPAGALIKGTAGYKNPPDYIAEQEEINNMNSFGVGKALFSGVLKPKIQEAVRNAVFVSMRKGYVKQGPSHG